MDSLNETTHCHRARAFTLAEAAISTVIVGVMMAGALTSVTRTGMFRRISNEQQLAYSLGEQLMAEVLSKSYWEPTSNSSTPIGPSNSESSAGNRSLFDDVDDYHDLIECPPESANGTDLPIGAGWYRRVQVSFVQWSNLEMPISSDYGLKRIWIEVGRIRPGGTANVAGDRQPITIVTAIAGRGRGL